MARPRKRLPNSASLFSGRVVRISEPILHSILRQCSANPFVLGEESQPFGWSSFGHNLTETDEMDKLLVVVITRLVMPDRKA